MTLGPGGRGHVLCHPLVQCSWLPDYERRRYIPVAKPHSLPRAQAGHTIPLSRPNGQTSALRESATATEQLREKRTSMEHVGEEERVPWTNFGKKALPSKAPPFSEPMPPSTEASQECWEGTWRQCSVAAWLGEPDTERDQGKGSCACQRGLPCMWATSQRSVIFS